MDGVETVPVVVDGVRVHMEVRATGARGSDGPGQEGPIGIRTPALEEALDGLMGVAKAMGARLRETGAAKASVEFGCEFAMESGSLVAVIGKAGGKSTFKVALEWTDPTAG
ncbi:CU044_2847 family protein [Sphaerisporangium dianthi]|uniref:CU044_2847 family protein n=1 Tax=Sphaerisporangium dianthi TaxID=1436120 RepID=A0ABV9CC30_9ACTN